MLFLHVAEFVRNLVVNEFTSEFFRFGLLILCRILNSLQLQIADVPVAVATPLTAVVEKNLDQCCNCSGQFA